MRVAEIDETMLPGVGVRHEFTTAGGDRVVVLTHRGGRREIAVGDRRQPDDCRTVLRLSPDDTRALAEVLGASHVSETVAGVVQQQIEGLAIDWLRLPVGSSFAGATIADGRFRTETNVSIVAIVRGDTTLPSPSADDQLVEGDVLVVVGTPEGLASLHQLLDQ
jgi:TrkA domain protein